MRREKLFVSIFLLVFLVFASFVEGADTKTMIVEPNLDYKKPIFSFRSSSVDEVEYGVRELTENEILEMQKNSAIVVREPYQVHAFLDDVAVMHNVTIANNLQIESINITGSKTSVCILDTGIDLDHPDLKDKIVAQHCFCAGNRSLLGDECCSTGINGEYNKSGDNASDDNGHGTHVAGIVGANGGINGVANDVNLVIVKVMNSDGNGGELDLRDGIEWCVDNADKYNITVISASLGADCDYNPELYYSNVCSEESKLTIQPEIQAAMNKNISVVFATGNDYNKTYISWPSCLPNVIPVSSIDKDGENISSFSNRASFLKLLGIGRNVNSTMPRYNVCMTNASCVSSGIPFSNNYAEVSGTSMATPVVAGSIALINQYLSLSGQTKTPSEIEDVLYETGFSIIEGLNSFSRVNVYDALLSLDVTNPEVVLTSPIDGLVTTNINQTFVCNVSDWQLKNITFYLWNESELINKTSWDVSGSSNGSIISIDNLPEVNYNWTCSVSDVNNNSVTATNSSLLISSIFVLVDSPENNTYTKRNETNFTCNSTTGNSYDLSNITFSLWNSTELVYNLTKNISGIMNSTIFNYTINETNYTWSCYVVDNISQSGSTGNMTIAYDVTYPTIENITNVTTSDSVSFSWDSLEYTNFSLNVSGLFNNSNLFNDTHSARIGGLDSETTYNFTISYCDRAGNCNVTDVFNITTDEYVAPVVPINDDSSHSSSPSSKKDPVIGSESNPISSEKIIEGYTKELRVNSRTYFENSNGDSHSVAVNKIVEGIVVIEIRSEPIIVNLKTNESVRLNLTSPEYYDLLVKVESVERSRADVLIKEIHEVNPYYVDEEERKVISFDENESYIEVVELSYFEKSRDYVVVQINKLMEKYPNLNFKALFVAMINVIIGIVVMILVIGSVRKENRELDKKMDKGKKENGNKKK